MLQVMWQFLINQSALFLQSIIMLRHLVLDARYNVVPFSSFYGLESSDGVQYIDSGYNVFITQANWPNKSHNVVWFNQKTDNQRMVKSIK